jgi:hypothetical protein
MPSIPPNGRYAIMCCGCKSLLGADGEVIAWNASGVLQNVAGFNEVSEGDEAANRAGWQVADKTGPNHRCPFCVHKEMRRYILREELFNVG